MGSLSNDDNDGNENFKNAIDLGAVYMEVERSNHQEDPRGWIILASYVFNTRFICKGLYLSLALESS